MQDEVDRQWLPSARRTAPHSLAPTLEARSGLAVFLRRGMRGWAHVTTTTTMPRMSSPRAGVAAPRSMPDDRATLVQRFVELVMTVMPLPPASAR